MADVPYDYRVRLGAYEWTGVMGDPAAYGPCDGLTLTRKLVESDLWPPAEDVAELKLQVIAADSAELDGLAVGDPVAFEYDATSLIDPMESFYGRVAELTSQPHDLGLLYTVSCLDYTADLRELDVGGTVAYPSESIQDRITRVMAEAGQTVTFATFAGQPPEASPMLAARAASATKLLDLVRNYLLWWPAVYEAPVGVFHGPWPMELVPVVDSSDELTGWRVQPIAVAPTYDGPLELVEVGGLWTARTDLDAPAGTEGRTVIDGAQVDFTSNYAMTKQDNPTRVTVAGEVFTGGPTVVTADLGVVPVVTAAIDSVELLDTADAVALAGMYLPSDVPTTRWLADAFLWHLELAQDDPNTACLPPLRTVVTVGGMDATRNPTGREWYTGQLSGYEFTIADKRPVYLFTMRRPDFSPAEGDDILRWNSPALVGITWAELDPGLTWDDLRLVKGST